MGFKQLGLTQRDVISVEKAMQAVVDAGKTPAEAYNVAKKSFPHLSKALDGHKKALIEAVTPKQEKKPEPEKKPEQNQQPKK